MTKDQAILTLADLAARGCGSDLFHRCAYNEAVAVVLPGIDDERAAQAKALAEDLRRTDAAQQKLWEGIGEQGATAAPAETRLTPDDVAGMFRAAALPVEIEGMWENYLTSCGDANSEAIPRAVFDDVVLAWMEAGGTREELRQRIEQAEHEHFATAAS